MLCLLAPRVGNFHSHKKLLFQPCPIAELAEGLWHFGDFKGSPQKRGSQPAAAADEPTDIGTLHYAGDGANVEWLQSNVSERR